MSSFGVEGTYIKSAEIVMIAVKRGKGLKKVTDVSKHF